MNVGVKIHGDAHALRKFAKITATLSGPGFIEAGVAGAKIVEAEMKRQAPIRTGNLRRSITSEVITSNIARFIIEIGTNLVYAAIQEFGGVIRAKNADYLVFQTPDGEWHSVAEVTIPAHPFIRPAGDIAGPKAAAAVVTLVHRILEAA